MTDSEIERVARAIWAAGTDYAAPEDAAQLDWQWFKNEARAAIQAMQMVPSEP